MSSGKTEVGKTVGCAVGAGVAGAGVGGLVCAGLGALSGVISGSTGAAVMQAAHYSSYNVSEAVHMGAVGGATLGGVSGALTGCCMGTLAGIGLFGSSASKAGGATVGLSTHVVNSMIGGVIGYALSSEAQVSSMSLGDTAWAFFIGSMISSVPISCGLACVVCVGLACCAVGGGSVEQRSVKVNNSEETNRLLSVVEHYERSVPGSASMGFK